MSKPAHSSVRSQFTILNSPFLMLLVLLVAAFLRLYQISTLPPGLNFDEAGSGVAALEILSGAPRIWWRLGGGQEPLWPYLSTLTTAILGNIPLALRLPAALIGVLSVAAVYPLLLTLLAAAPEARQRHLIALLTALGLAVSAWHLHFSRLGFRAILLPLFSTLAFYFLWYGMVRSQRLVDSRQNLTFYVLRNKNLILAALFLALAIYSYLAARLLVLAPLLFFALHWLMAKLRWQLVNHARERPIFPASRSVFFLIFKFLFFLILFLTPLIIYFAFNPADLVARSTTVSIFNPQWHQGDLAATLWRTIIVTLGALVGLGGDPNPLVNLPGQSALPLLLAPFFIVGVVASLQRAFSPGSRPWPLAAAPHLFLLCWWAVMLLPAILAPEGAPHHLRLIGAIVPSYALVALGWVTALNLLTKLLGRISPRLAAARLALLLPGVCYLLLAWQTYQHYFIRWPASTDFTLPFDLYAVRLAEQIAQTPPDAVYVLPMDIRAGAEARHYTLDYLWGLRQPSPYRYIPVDERNAAAGLTQAARNKTELRVVRWTADKHREADAKELLTYLLETTAQWQAREDFPVYAVDVYRLPGPDTRFVWPTINQPLDLTFSAPDTSQALLQVEKIFVPAVGAPGKGLPLALTLAPLAPLPADYKASLRLVGPTGERLAQKDRILLHNFHQGTSLWPPETVNEYYLLPVPPLTPPGDYTITLALYHPDTLAPLVAQGLAEVPLGQVKIE
jgi:hypothetical protein